ncbi:hypothetical protein ACLB2K_005138 [Fragaria x ananassa]
MHLRGDRKRKQENIGKLLSLRKSSREATAVLFRSGEPRDKDAGEARVVLDDRCILAFLVLLVAYSVQRGMLGRTKGKRPCSIRSYSRGKGKLILYVQWSFANIVRKPGNQG